jgi:hypothetical protein
MQCSLTSERTCNLPPLPPPGLIRYISGTTTRESGLKRGSVTMGEVDLELDRKRFLEQGAKVTAKPLIQP